MRSKVASNRHSAHLNKVDILPSLCVEALGQHLVLCALSKAGALQAIHYTQNV